MYIRKPVVCVIVALSLGACQTSGNQYGGGGIGGMDTSQTVGTVGGAVAGGLLGSRFGGGTGKLVAVGIGTLLGAFAGREIAQRLTDGDQTRAAAAEQQAITQNQTITWNNPQSGYNGSVKPVRTYQAANGQTCRDYTHTIMIEGRYETARGTACRQPDGTWVMQS
jgi:surface antigen